MKKYTSKVFKRIACPRCDTAYEVPLAIDEGERTGVFRCHSTTNKAMMRTHCPLSGEAYEWLYCGQVIAYDISRGHTSVAMVPDWNAQPNRLRREKEEQPNVRGNLETTA